MTFAALQKIGRMGPEKPLAAHCPSDRLRTKTLCQNFPAKNGRFWEAARMQRTAGLEPNLADAALAYWPVRPKRINEPLYIKSLRAAQRPGELRTD